MIALHSARNAINNVEHAYQSRDSSSAESDDEIDSPNQELLMLAEVCGDLGTIQNLCSSRNKQGKEDRRFQFSEEDLTSFQVDRGPEQPLTLRRHEDLKKIIVQSNADVEDLVSEERFEKLEACNQKSLLNLLPVEDVVDRSSEDAKLADSALTNEYVSHACRDFQQIVCGTPPPPRDPLPREQHPREAKLRRKRNLHRRYTNESTASEDTPSETNASFSGDWASGAGDASAGQFAPLQCLAAAAEVAAAGQLPAAMVALPSPLPAASSPVVAADMAAVADLPAPAGPKQRVSRKSESADGCAPVKKKRGAGKKPSRAELLAASGTSARTEGLRKNDASGTPARLTGSSQLSKLPPTAKVGHLRSRYSTIGTALAPVDVVAPEQADGDSYTVMCTGFDHDYASFQPERCSFGLVPLLSRGYSTEHDYARHPSSTSGVPSRPLAAKRRSLGDLSTLPSMSLSPLLSMKEPLAITLPSPIEPVTIEDANVVSQLQNRTPPAVTPRPREQQGIAPLAGLGNDALSLLARTANSVGPPRGPSGPT